MIYIITITTLKDKTAYVCDDSTIDAVRKKAITSLKRGHEVTWSNGDTQWIEKSPILNFDKESSEKYTWDDSGNKVLNEILLYTKDKSNNVTCEKIDEKFVNFI